MSSIPAFLSIPIQGIRDSEDIYQTILAVLEEMSFHVLNEKEVTNVPIWSEVLELNAQDVHEYDIGLLRNSEVFITEVSKPSLGVGYEIREAEKLGLPIIYLYNANYEGKVSLMILGSPYKDRKTIAYSSKEDLKTKFKSALAEIPFKKEKHSLDKIVAHFNTKSVSYNSDVNWRKDQGILDWFRSVINSGESCMDLGTGTGIVGAEIKKNGIKVIGVDASSKMLEAAKDQLDMIVHSDITKLPFLNEQFDAITIRQVLHYIEDVSACLTEVNRVLKKEGLFACAHVSASDEEVANWWRGLKQLNQPLRKRFFVTDQLSDLIVQNGFTLVNKSSYFIQRSDDWETFLINSNNAEDAEKIREYLTQTTDAVKEMIQLKVTSDKIAYIQEWSLTVFKRR